MTHTCCWCLLTYLVYHYLKQQMGSNRRVFLKYEDVWFPTPTDYCDLKQRFLVLSDIKCTTHNIQSGKITYVVTEPVCIYIKGSLYVFNYLVIVPPIVQYLIKIVLKTFNDSILITSSYLIKNTELEIPRHHKILKKKSMKQLNTIIQWSLQNISPTSTFQ